MNMTFWKKFGVIFSLSFLAIGGAVIVEHNVNGNSASGGTSNYTLTLNGTNGQLSNNASYPKSEVTNTTATTGNGNHIEIACYYAAVFTSGSYTNVYAQLKGGLGYFYNTDTTDAANSIYPITNIVSLKATFAGTAPTLYYGNSKNPSTNSTTLSSGTTVTAISGYSFFKILAGSNVCYLESLEIVYSCNGSDTPSVTLSSLAITDSNESYTVGQTYSSANGLTVTGTYSDGSTGVISSGYTINGTGFTPTSAFTTAGTYAVSVSYSGVTSESINITVVDAPIVDPTAIAISDSSLSLTVGDTQTLTYTLTPSDASTTITWASTNPAVASVSDGLVTALTAGETTISVSTANGLSDSCAVTVAAAAVGDWTLVKSTSDLVVGDSYVIACNTKGMTAGDISSSIMSNITSTFALDYSSITSLGTDTVQLTLGGSTGAWTFKNSSGSLLGATDVKKMAWGTETTTWSISIDSSYNSTISSTTSSYGSLQYNSSSPRFTTYTSSQTSIQLYKQSSEPIYATSISVSPTSLALGVNETSTALAVTFNPTTTNQKTISWTTEGSSVATVNSDGVVTGVGVGTTNIVATAATSASTTTSVKCAVTVSNISVTGVEVNLSSTSISVGATKTLSASITPSNATNKNVTWSSGAANVATVSSTGVVTGEAEGVATITVTTVDGGLTATCEVTVTAAPVVSKTTIAQTYNDYYDNNYYNVDNCPTTGNPKLLIIPIWFTDSSSYVTTANKANVKSDIEKAYLGTTTETGWNSVKSFYETESDGNVTLTGTVSDWYECGQSTSSYASSSTGGSNTTSLVTTASDWYFTNHTSESRSDYDTDNDGYLDGVLLIYAAPDYSAWGKSSSSYGNFWAYCFWLQDTNVKNVSNPGANVFFWASYDFMYGSNATSRAGTSYNSGDTSNCTIDAHTFIHEMGHVFGLDDYYDYSYAYKPAGGFSMQDYNVGGHDAYSVMAYGWADPYIPNESCTIQIGAFQKTHEMILLTPSWNTYNSAFDEYLLLELYTPTGLNEFDTTNKYSGSPQGPNAVGIRLWHVDARLTYASGNSWSTSLTSNCANGNISHAMSNTYYSSDAADYISPLGQSYANYNILQLIRNNTSATYKPTDSLSESSLFKDGSSFNMSIYSGQFVNTGKLNSNTTLGWSFTVSISGTGSSATASIVLTKA